MRVALLALSLWLLAAPVQGQSGDTECLQSVNDPQGDQETPSTPLLNTDPADVLRVEMEWMDAGLRLYAQLGGDPREVEDVTYSYWIGFEDGGRSAGGNPPTWTWQHDSLYERIRTMYWSGPDWYEVTWEENAFWFIIPWPDFDAQYGANWTHDIGSPSISSSGPVVPGTLANGVSQDRADYARDVVPLRPCPPETTPAVPRDQVVPVTGNTTHNATAAPVVNEAPAPFAAVAVLVATIMMARRLRG